MAYDLSSNAKQSEVYTDQNIPQGQRALMQSDAQQRAIEEFGLSIFHAIGTRRPAVYQKSFWSKILMDWTLTRPALKTDLFRLVDVLPALREPDAIAQHTIEYLAPHRPSLPAPARWALAESPGSARARLLAFAVQRGVSEMAQQFIAGENAAGALKPLRRLRKQGCAYTVDLLGEYTLSEAEAHDYLARYREAIATLGRESAQKTRFNRPIIPGHPGEERASCVSVKLSALYSQCGPLNFTRSVSVLTDRLTQLAQDAKAHNVQLYVDAEDSANNPIIYSTFEQVFGTGDLKTFRYPGLVIQAYAKGAPELTERMIAFAKRRGAPIAVRLVKGAYWDSETISSALNDWPSPLLAQKESSDAQFEYLSRVLLDNAEHVLPAFASHNIRSLSHACCYAQARGVTPKQFELQMLYGMAEPIAAAFASRGYLVRFYVPLGDLFVGMGYLVRRLLENTSNESFLRHTFVEQQKALSLLREPRFQD